MLSFNPHKTLWRRYYHYPHIVAKRILERLFRDTYKESWDLSLGLSYFQAQEFVYSAKSGKWNIILNQQLWCKVWITLGREERHRLQTELVPISIAMVFLKRWWGPRPEQWWWGHEETGWIQRHLFCLKLNCVTQARLLVWFSSESQVYSYLS